MVAAGGMCLTIDAGLAAYIRRDVLDDLLGIPLAEADEALRFVVRPQQPIRFNLGTGTILAPHLRADLDVLAGTIADVVFSTIGAGAGTVLVSDFAGYSLNNVAVQRVTTASDDFLAVSASLAVSPSGGNLPAPTPQPLSTRLLLPTPGALRVALLAGDSAGLPTLHVELATTDGGARPLEHSCRTAGGVWRPYVATGDLVIRDRSFAWQGERTGEPFHLFRRARA